MRRCRPLQWIEEAEQRQFLAIAAHDASEAPAARAPAWSRNAIRRWIFDRAAVRALMRGGSDRPLDAPGEPRPAAEFANNG